VKMASVVRVCVPASGSVRAVGGNMCRTVCRGVLERGIGSFEMQLSRSTRDTCASHPAGSFSGLSRGSFAPFSLFF
jgi:hypothetical protein